MLRTVSSLLRQLSFISKMEFPTPCPRSSAGSSIWSPPYLRAVVVQCFRTSASVRGLEEFFPRTDNPVEEGERSGRPWLARELRHKSSEDLHKLWYVLLKERNMLMTVKHEANRELFIMPGPERLRKVRRSMARIKLVLFERERALSDAKRILEGVSVESAVKKPQVPHKLRKFMAKRKKAISKVQSHTCQQKVKKRRNVRNYRHIAAVRELEQNS